MDIPPPPWEQQSQSVSQSVTPAPAEALATKIPPPPWKQQSETPALDDLYDQQQANAREFADVQARGEILRREAGDTKPHLSYDAQGNPVIENIPQPAQQLSVGEKAAILDAQRAAAGVGGQTLYNGHAAPVQSAETQTGADQAAQIQAATRSQNTVAQNFGGAVGQTFGNAATSVRGVWNPQAASRQQEDIANTFESDPDSKAAMAGRVGANVVMAVPTVAAPTVGATLMAAQTFGGVRNEVAQRRAQGQQITPAQEYMAAGGQALMTFLASKFAGNYNQAASKTLLLQNAALRREGASVVANTIKQYALSAGVGLSDMEAMTLANNAIAKYTVAPDRDISEGLPEAATVGGLSGPVMLKVGNMVHGTPNVSAPRERSSPISPEEAAAAAPTAKQMADITTAPAEPTVNNTEPAKPAKGPTSLEASKQKYRIQDGANSRGVEVQFDDPNDKALYVATQPRKGKLQAEAVKLLTEQGYKPDAIARYGDEVRSRVEEAARGHTGDVLRLPRAQEVGENGQSVLPEAPKTVPGNVSPELKPGEQQGTLFMPSPEKIKEATDAAATEVRGFKVVPPRTADHVEASKVFAKRGVKVVYFKGEGKGFRMQRHPGVLFVNADKPVASFREAISHEFIHELHDSRPALFQELSNAVGPEGRAKWEQWYATEFNKMRPGETPHALDQEGVTTPIGKLASSNERVWTAAMGKDPSLLQKIGDFARPFLAKFSSKSRQIQAAVKAFEATLDIPIGKSTKQSKSYGEEAVNFLPSERVRKEAEEYTREAGIPYHPDTTNATVNVPRAETIAKWYEQAKHEPNSPEVKRSYDALKKETLDQFRFLEKQGIKLEPWTKEGQPYADSKEMAHDAQDNKHLYFFQGGDMPADHPLAEKAPGTPYSYNDVFRAVHDYFGHAKEGTGFGPRGEENAWRSHSQMYSETARPAMTTETRGQNSWVNFGPHGEANRANPKNTRYAEQKATLPPTEFTKVERENGTTFAPDFPPKEYPESDYGYWLTPDGKAHAVPPESHDDVARSTLNAKSTSDALARGYTRIVAEPKSNYATIEISEDANPAQAKKFAAAAIANGREVHVDVFGSGENIYLRRLSDLSKLDKIGAEQPLTFLPSGKEDKEKALKSIETTKLREEPLSAEKGMFGTIAPEKGSMKNEEVARLLNERTKELAGQAKARESEKLARAIAAGVPEAEYQLQQPDSGKSWYKDDIAKMEKIMIERHTSLHDPAHMTIFKAILAITSQGNNPNVNLKHADPIYEHWYDTGEMLKTQPGGKNWPGTLGENYKLPLGRLEKLIEQKGVKDAAAWLLSKHTVQEINDFSTSIGMNPNVSGPKDAMVYGMEMFGPKIGVFALNQHGIQEKITKDMWFSRTWNRWMGTMLENGEIVDAPRNDQERELMDKAVSALSEKLGMEPSEVQAVLWYYEQQLWKAHGSKVESGSYSKAAERVANGDAYDLGRAQFESEREQIEKGRTDSSAGGLYGSDVPGRSGSGPSKPDFLPGGKFIEDDVKPRLADAADGVKKAWEGVKSLVAPFTRSAAAKQASLILRERGGELAQRFGRLDEAFHKSRDLFDKLSVADSRQFIDDVENGRKTTNPALQPIADAVRAILDDRLKQVQALGTGKLASFIQDYFPHIWENPRKAAKVWQDAVAKAPLEGGKSFLKSRTLPKLADGLARGLKPVTENPIEAMMLRVREMDKYITAHQAFNEMESIGLLKKVKARDVAKHPGYARINDNIATIFAKPSRRGALQIQAYRMAPESVANVINNYLSPGLKSNKFFGGLFRGYLAAGNTMNQAQLGLSFFHAAFVSYDAAVSSFALGLKNVAKGRVVTGGRQIGEALTLVGPAVRSWRNGTAIMKEWNSPGSTTPEIAALVDAMKAGGGRITMDEFHRTGWRDSFKKALKAGNGIGAALRLPLATIETVSAPILEKMVPRMKAGVFFEMAQHELENLKGSTDRNALRDAMGKAWDSVDNRMGELVYDNLFWNKAVKDLAMASTRSVGWNLGTLREVGGGLTDLAKNTASATLGRGRNVEFTHRAAYAVALPVMTGILGAIIHRLLTGENPKELKDYYFPKTGRKDKDGHDVRLTLPSYMKDVFAYKADPVTTISHKLHPMANTIMEMLSNSDFYGTKIVNEDDHPLKQAADYAKHFGKAFVPFGVREAVKLGSEGQGSRSLLPLIGITEARRDITNSPAELLASKLAAAGMPKGTRTQEEADKSQLTRELGDKVRNHEPGAIGEIKAALESGKLTPSSIDQIAEHQQFSRFERTIRHLSVQDAMKVWDVASPDERRVMGKILIPRAVDTESLPPDQKRAILERLRRDWQSLSAKAEE